MPQNAIMNIVMFLKLFFELSNMQVGPEKGVTHLATAAIINALWDLWARVQQKPLWKLLVDMEPEQLVSTIDFRYM
jgi:L-fuconate dehydratase